MSFHVAPRVKPGSDLCSRVMADRPRGARTHSLAVFVHECAPISVVPPLTLSTLCRTTERAQAERAERSARRR
eukprot:7099213-Alexandrium_andersonii.AAC.1